MSDYKYIILSKGNQELPVIFPGNFVHLHVAEAMRAMLAMEALSVMPEAMRNHPRVKQDVLKAIQPVAAGFTTFNLLSATGMSETLNLSSRPIDFDIINTFPYSHGLKL